jgi:hypothetical protein
MKEQNWRQAIRGYLRDGSRVRDERNTIRSEENRTAIVEKEAFETSKSSKISGYDYCIQKIQPILLSSPFRFNNRSILLHANNCP